MISEKVNCANLISREVLVKVSEDYGVPESALYAAMHEPPHFWSRSTRTTRRLYLTFIRAALLDYATEGCMVYHGNAGHFLLNGVDWLLKVRLIAPMESRIFSLLQSQQIDRYEAELQIKKADDERKSWTKFLYNEDWDDPVHFDIVINLKEMSLETASDIISQMAGLPEFEPTEERMLKLENMASEARVQAAFEVNPKTREADVDLRADGPKIYLSGQVSNDRLESDLIEVAGGVSGIKEVISELKVV